MATFTTCDLATLALQIEKQSNFQQFSVAAGQVDIVS